MERVWDKFLGERDRQVYDASGFGRPGGLGARPAVIVVDVTYAFIGHERLPIEESMGTWRNSCGEAGWAALPVIRELLEAARDKRLPVFYTTGTSTRPDRFDRGAWDFKNDRATADVLPPDLASLANQIPTEIEPLRQEFVIAKSKPSAFFGTPLLSHLIHLNVDSLIICGTTTSGCVRGSVLDAFNLNYHLAVVEDATFDRFESSHALSLFDMNAKYADVIPLDAVRTYLDSVPVGLYDDKIHADPQDIV